MFITKIRFHWQAFIVFKYGNNLKILTEIFRQKLIVSNVIRPSETKNFLRRMKHPPLFKISGSSPDI